MNAPESPGHDPMGHDPMGHHPMGHNFGKHVQEHLDRLAGRLEIKASQEDAWQKFSAAFRDVMTPHHPMEGMEANSPHGEQDAATMARKHADMAAEHAQKLAHLADATAALQQALNAQQRLVFNEVARHFAHEHGAHAGMGHPGMEHGAYGEHGGDDCERAGAGYGHGGPEGTEHEKEDPHAGMSH